MRSVILLFLTAFAAQAADTSAVVGKIGDIEMKTLDVREAIAGLDPARQDALAKDPAALGQYVRALLIQRLVLKEAQEKKWDQEPDVIAKLVRARESTIAESFLDSASAPPPGYPSEAEIKESYEANKDKLVIPKTYQLAQIYIEVPKAADKTAEAAAKAKLDAVTGQLAAKGADFAAIARKSSEDPASAARGGEIGWLSEAQIQPEIREKLPNLKLNSISAPLRLNDGWHILKVLDIRESRTAMLNEVRDELVTNLRSGKSRIIRQEFVAGLLQKHPLAINEIELMKTASPAAE